jgi:hypothetical protein
MKRRDLSKRKQKEEDQDKREGRNWRQEIDELESKIGRRALSEKLNDGDNKNHNIGRAKVLIRPDIQRWRGRTRYMMTAIYRAWVGLFILHTGNLMCVFGQWIHLYFRHLIFLDCQKPDPRDSRALLAILLRLQDNSFEGISTGDQSWFLYEHESESLFAVSREIVSPRCEHEIQAKKIMISVFLTPTRLLVLGALPSR